MINGIIGKKVGMTQIFAADGTVTPVTVIKAGPCVVVLQAAAGVLCVTGRLLNVAVTDAPREGTRDR